MKRARLWAGAGISVLALAGWLAIGHLQPEVRSPAVSVPAADESAAAVTASAASMQSESVDEAVPFQTLLLPDGGVSADPTSVRIGLARVAPEDAAAYHDRVLGGGDGGGAGPSSIEELATVERWMPIPARRLDDRSVLAGPIRLPHADRYELQARASDRLHFYAAAFAPDDAPASIAPMVAAGLRVQRDSTGGGDAQLLLRRVASAPNAARWQRLMEREAPELLAAFDEDAIPIAPAQVLAPLPPGPLELVLRVDGVDAQTLPVTLVAGRVTEVRFDPVAEAVARAVSVDLELQFVTHGSGEPIEGLDVTWFGPRGEHARTADADGRVRFDGLDRMQTHRFNMRAAPPADGLPTWPELQHLAISFDDDASDAPPPRLQRRRIALPQLEWIVARGVPQPAPNVQRRSPYPIHVLQQAHDGDWADRAADHFIELEDGLAVSITEPGRFRVASVVSPWRILHSTAADTRHRTTDAKYRVDVIHEPGHRAAITVLHDGVALSNTPVGLRGPTRGLPPETLTTDSRGRLQLDGVTVPTVWLEYGERPEQAVDVRGGAASVEFGGG